MSWLSFWTGEYGFDLPSKTMQMTVTWNSVHVQGWLGRVEWHTTMRRSDWAVRVREEARMLQIVRCCFEGKGTERKRAMYLTSRAQAGVERSQSMTQHHTGFNRITNVTSVQGYKTSLLTEKLQYRMIGKTKGKQRGCKTRRWHG